MTTRTDVSVKVLAIRETAGQVAALELGVVGFEVIGEAACEEEGSW